ncbi:MAG: hypothetical protein ACI8RD_001799 [Bacillariaceae sp.]|jgi:hypothetical protein
MRRYELMERRINSMCQSPVTLQPKQVSKKLEAEGDDYLGTFICSKICRGMEENKTRFKSTPFAISGFGIKKLVDLIPHHRTEEVLSKN